MIKHRKTSPLRQRGGTVVGIIIGLIIGLAIALVVAVAITKTSLPFLNKVGKQDKAPELTAGQASDPNKPLYSSDDAAKEAAKGFAATTDVAAPTADGKPVEPGMVNPAANPASPTPPAQPVASGAPVTNPKPGTEAKAAESTGINPTAKPDNADDKWVYYLQAGAFREQADAENSKAKLALAGFEASILDRSSDAGPLYRVRIGPFNQLEAMNRARGKLSDNGIDVAVMRIAK